MPRDGAVTKTTESAGLRSAAVSTSRDDSETELLSRAIALNTSQATSVLLEL